MAGDVRHFEIPYVKAYLAKRFHRTAFGWKATDPGRNATVEGPIAAISVNAVDEAFEQVRHEGGEVAQGKQSFGEMG